jgi:putative phosphoesterase
MRILLVADIHGNRAALDAIQEPHDVCLCLGDIVEYGPDTTGATDWVRQHATHTVRGNHDHGAAQNVAVAGAAGFKYLTMATRRNTIAQLTAADRRFLADLPTSLMLTLGGKRFLLVHASPRDPLDEYVPTDTAAWTTRVADLNVDFVCVGHTHVQSAMTVGQGVTVVNPGSIGLQRDGNPRAKYAIIEDGKVQLKQIPYDIDRTVAAVDASPLDPQAKRMLTDVYRLGKLAPADSTPMPGRLPKPAGVAAGSAALRLSGGTAKPTKGW